MIVNKDTKAWEMVYGASKDSYIMTNHWFIDDNSELASKIINIGLDWDPVLDSKGELIDCIPHVNRFVNEKIKQFREFRSRQFRYFDIYKTNVDYGIIVETEQTRLEIIDWYNLMLIFPEQINEENYDVIEFPETPSPILQYTSEY